MKRTLVLLKPDALERGLVGEIISRLEGQGLKVVAVKMIWVDGALAKRHYAVHEGKPFFEELVEFITSRPIIAAIFEGEDAVAVVRSAMGETDPARAAPGTIRGDLAQDIGRNLIHGSDSEETAETEIDLFFSKSEILSY
ncbi:MAG: nucleoside-diphosphate kinase [Dehalococcoidia bacterium]|nr:nucleoside-diphosphate kinase [Dehalococcoidia bacterium]